jgi:hypothetical protein
MRVNGLVLMGLERNPLAVNVHLGELDLIGTIEVAVDCQIGDFVVLYGKRKHWGFE